MLWLCVLGDSNFLGKTPLLLKKIRTLKLWNFLLFLKDQNHKHSPTEYLIDQIEPPPEYASQTPSAAYAPNENDYAEILRRNAYNHQLG